MARRRVAGISDDRTSDLEVALVLVAARGARRNADVELAVKHARESKAGNGCGSLIDDVVAGGFERLAADAAAAVRLPALMFAELRGYILRRNVVLQLSRTDDPRQILAG